MLFTFLVLYSAGLLKYDGAGNARQRVPYIPNSVSLLRLETQAAWRGINISFNQLTINTEMGEYILIGTGEYFPLRGYFSQVKRLV